MDMKTTLQTDLEKLQTKLAKNEKQIENLKQENEKLVMQKKFIEDYIQKIENEEITTL